MNSFERFKNKQRRRDSANEHYNAQFIFNAYNSTTIRNDEVEVQAAVVSKQEKDQGYIYTHYNDTLEVGSIWEVNTLHWLIVEEIISIKDTDYHKYFALLCNVDLGITWGYFKSRLGIRNEQDTALESTQEPQITLPAHFLDYQDKIVLDGRAWIVQEWDSISKPGITFYSLQASTVSKDEAQDRNSYIVDVVRVDPEVTTEEIDITDTAKGIGHNVPVTLTTEGGYLKYIGNLKIMKRTAQEITFALPFGVDEVEVSVKENGEVVTYHYYGVD